MYRPSSILLWRVSFLGVADDELTCSEWDMVTSGVYSDPDPLTLHPVPEYNLHYFPRLCLQETPTVNMTEHDSARPDFEDANPNRRTPLNDELTYAMECRAAKEVFRGFEWSRDQAETWQDEGPGYQVSSSDEDDEEGLVVPDELGDGMTLNWSISDQLGMEGSQELDLPPLPGLGAEELDSEPVTRPPSATSDQSFTPELDPRSPTPIIDGVVEEGLPLQVPTEDVTPDVAQETVPEPESSPTIEVTTPPLSPAPSLSREIAPPASPQAIKVPSPRPKTKLRLPSGLPASGLSSSEIVSIPSPDPNSPTRLVRRHPPGFGRATKPSVDTVHTLRIANHANHRLSVDLHGTISNLGDEDWEKLETDTGYTNIPSISNAAPSAFFTRGLGTLRRRPSAINTGGGYRRHKNSTTSDSASGDSSPIKMKHRPIFNVKSIENTKKALKTLKAFPRMISRGKYPDAQSQGQIKSTAPSRVTTPTSPPPAAKNGVSAPNTGTASWFTTRRLGLSRSFNPRPTRSTTPSSASTGSSTHTYANDMISRPNDVRDQAKGQNSSRGQGVPRVGLIQSPPVDWDLGVEGEKEVDPSAGRAEAGEEEGGSGTITKKQRDEFKSEQRQTDGISSKV